jgi:hypothetical protein
MPDSSLELEIRTSQLDITRSALFCDELNSGVPGSRGGHEDGADLSRADLGVLRRANGKLPASEAGVGDGVDGYDIIALANHSVELLVHWIRGTHNLFSRILASVILTAFSTLFNFYIMRRGTMIVGAGRRSLGTDLLSLPVLVLDFLAWLPRYAIRKIARGTGSRPFHED